MIVMNIVVISGSNRGGSQSLKVAKWLDGNLKQQDVESMVLDLHEFKLPLYDDGETVAENQPALLEMLEKSDGYVFVSPEWNGMMSVALANMLHYVEHEMAYKPVMLVGVSSGRGGTHPVDQMKLLGQKNRHYVISPENLIVSGVEQVFNDEDMDSDSTATALKQRAEYCLKILNELSKTFATVRSSSVIDLDRFANGV